MASTTLKTILITGCSGGGIGWAIAKELASHGHHVFATARDIRKIPTELASLSNVTVFQLDVTSESYIKLLVECVAAVTEKLGSKGLDVLVNNAGAGYTMPLLDQNIDQAKALYDTNVWGPLRMVQLFSDLLIAKQGRVIMISSAGGYMHTPWIGTYCSSKAALTLLSETLRLELAPLGVSVVTVMTGIIKTNFTENMGTLELPETSRYKPIRDIINRPPTIELSAGATDVEELAKSLVKDIVGGESGGLVWKGYKAGSVWILSKVVPAFILDYFLSEGRGLDELSKTPEK